MVVGGDLFDFLSVLVTSNLQYAVVVVVGPDGVILLLVLLMLYCCRGFCFCY